jgi:hypothetical protein
MPQNDPPAHKGFGGPARDASAHAWQDALQHREAREAEVSAKEIRSDRAQQAADKRDQRTCLCPVNKTISDHDDRDRHRYTKGSSDQEGDRENWSPRAERLEVVLKLGELTRRQLEERWDQYLSKWHHHHDQKASRDE